MIIVAAALALLAVNLVDASEELKHVTLYNNGESHGGVAHIVRRSDFAQGKEKNKHIVFMFLNIDEYVKKALQYGARL